MLSLALMSLSDPQPVGMGISASLLIRVTNERCILHSPSDNSHRVEPQLPTVASLLTYLLYYLSSCANGVRKPEGRVLMRVPLNVNYRNCQLQIPTGKDMHCISSKTLATPTTQSMRNHHHLELLLFSKTTPPNFLFFFCKAAVFSLVCWTCLWLLGQLVWLCAQSLSHVRQAPLSMG